MLHPFAQMLLSRQAPDVALLDIRESTSALTTYTFSNVSLGNFGGVASTSGDTYGAVPHVRSPSRGWILMFVHGEDALTAFTVSTATIGGVAGTKRFDSAGSTQLSSTAIFTWTTDILGDIANTDVVVTYSEAVSGCAIGVVFVSNIGAAVHTVSATGSGGTGTIPSSPTVPVASADRYMAYFMGTTCVTGTPGETVSLLIDGASPFFAPMLIYERANSVFSYAAAWTWAPSYFGGLQVRFAVSWSGTGGGEGVSTVLL